MSELPWYGWLNLIGLMALWMFYGFGHMLEKSGRLTRIAHHLVIVFAVLFVSGLYQLLQSHVANWPIIAAGVFLFAATFWELFGGTYMIIADAAKPEKSPEPVQDQVPHTPVVVDAVTSDGALDLDAGTRHSPENREKVEQAIKGVFASDSSATDRLKGIGTLLSLGDDEEDEPDSMAENVGYGLIGIAIVAAILVPPCLIACRAMGLLD